MTSAIIAVAVVLFCLRILFGKPVAEWLDRVESRAGRQELWHPESPGVRVTVQPGLPRRLGLVREPFATSREMKSVYKMNARRGDPRRAAQERVLSADEVRKLEREMGVGPFAGKENWCDPAEQCYHRDHGPIDEETGLWKVIPAKPDRFLLPDIKEPLVAKEYKPGQLPEVVDIGVKEVGLKELTVDQATKMIQAGILPRRVLAELLGERPDPQPNRVTHSSYTYDYCSSSLHDHTEIMSLQGPVRRICNRNY